MFAAHKNTAINHWLNKHQYCLERVIGNSPEGQSQYAYILVKMSNLDSFRTALATQSVVLADYGIVLATGNGIASPDGLEDVLLQTIMKQA